MTTVQSVSVGLGLNDYPVEATTPTTPRAPLSASTTALAPLPTESPKDNGPKTPTRLTFGGLAGQRPLPSSPFRSSFSSSQKRGVEGKLDEGDRGEQGHETQSAISQDVAMDDSDEGDGDSDAESIDAETGRPSKKKKGQRFFCTEFPPCKLSFTRSEHLARHIRKHTGERPFACHCSRRFSRLDNLRQHAQTVHVNEEIPGDSLAATGTRFQRQIRTDKVVRPTSSRSRPSTANSQGGHPRGHARNLSASSIGSTASTVSRDDGRRRPPPLMMANDPTSRARLSLDVMRNGALTPPGQSTFYRESSEGVSTPTSTTFSTGQNSPGYGSSLGSPMSAVSRTGGGFWDGRSHGRRLSVPSGPAPFQSPQHIAYGSPYLSPLASSTASTFSNLSSSFGSPNSSVAYTSAGRDVAESDIRRRTWHPTTYYNSYSRPATSGLSYYQTPDAPRPAFAPQATAAASQPQRLPGIETFDQAPRKPTTPPIKNSSPMRIDNAIRPPVYPGHTGQPQSGPNDRRGHASWDMSLHQNLTKLDLAVGSPANDTGARPQYVQSADLRPSDERVQQSSQGPPIIHQEMQKRSAEDSHYPSSQTSRSKRQGWYAGPPPLAQQANFPLRNSPGTSSGSEGVPTTPSFPSTDHNPAIMHDNGYVESSSQASALHTGDKASIPGSQQQPSWPLPSNSTQRHYDASHKDTEMSGLEVLVAVATREEDSAAAPNA